MVTTRVILPDSVTSCRRCRTWRTLTASARWNCFHWHFCSVYSLHSVDSEQSGDTKWLYSPNWIYVSLKIPNGTLGKLSSTAQTWKRT